MLDGDLRSFPVTNLADHHHVRVLPQEGTQSAGEIQPDAWLDVDLIDAFQLDFHWIFGSADIAAGLIEPSQAGIQRYRLATPGGARDQNHALWRGQGGFVEPPLHRGEAELVDMPVCRGGIEQA